VTFNTGSSIINGPYVKITLNEEKRFNYYRLGQTSSALAAYSIAGFTLYGSNDNVSYTLLNQQTNYNLVGTIGVWNPKIVLGEQQYRYIVIHINKLAGSGTVADVMNMEIGYE